MINSLNKPILSHFSDSCLNRKSKPTHMYVSIFFLFQFILASDEVSRWLRFRHYFGEQD